MAVTVNGSVLTQTDVTSPSPSTLTYTNVVLTAGDILVSVVAENSPSTFGTFSAPTGGTGLSWTQIILQQNTAGHFTEVVGYWTKIPSDQTSTITVSTTNTSDVGTGGALLRLSGVDQVSPIGLTDGFAGQTDPTGTDLQLAGTAAGSLIIMVGSDWSAGTASLTVSISNTTGGVTDLSNLESGQFRAVVAHASQSSSTNQGTLDYSAATGDWAAVIFEIKATPTAGGVSSARPGKTWKRRYKHRQLSPTPPPAVAGDFTASVSATVTETDTVTAVAGEVADVTATVTAGGTVTAVVGAVGAVSATVTCGSTVTAVVGAVGAVTATVVCGSTVTASTVSGLIGTVNTTVTAGGTVTAVIGRIGAVNTTVTTGSTVSAAVAAFGAVNTTVTAGSTVTAIVARFGAVTATVTSGSTVIPFLLGAIIDVNGRVITTQMAVSIVDVTSSLGSQAGIDQSTISTASRSSAAGGAAAVDPTSDGRAEVG